MPGPGQHMNGSSLQSRLPEEAPLRVACLDISLLPALGLLEGCSLLLWATQLLCKQTPLLLPVTLKLSLPLK